MLRSSALQNHQSERLHNSCGSSIGLERPLLCCIDEYENLLPYQQAALNTYIKHSEFPLSYKVGMKADGLKTRDTLTER